MRLLIAIVAILIPAEISAAAVSPEPIEIGANGRKLSGFLFRPQGSGPFPAVVGLHGCGGLKNSIGAVQSRYRDWADKLTGAGFAVVFPDSYGSRNLGSQCTVRYRTLRPEREIVQDALAARQWLQAQSWIVADRISLVGWSNGGISTLWAIRRQGPALAQSTNADFRSAIAFYPGCRRLGTLAWSARVPTLILIGRADDWTPASHCEQMVRGARGRSAGVSIVVFPRAYHDFDHPNRSIQIRTGYAFSADGSGRVHTGTNAAARAEAIKRTLEWLAR